MAYKRARKEEQKAERRASILATARELCVEQGVMTWSLNELGRRADVNKSNLYRYFGSREEILMVLMHEEMERFVDSFAQHLAKRRLTAGEFAEIMAGQYTAQPFLCELLSLATAILEHNVDIEAIQAIKLDHANLLGDVAEDIAGALDGIDAEAAGKIAMTSSVLVVGLWPMANPAAAIRDLSKLEGLQWLDRAFHPDLADAIHTYVAGLQARAAEQDAGPGRKAQ